MPLYDFDCGKHRFEAFCHQYTEELPCRGEDRTCERTAKVIFVAVRGHSWDGGVEPVCIHRDPRTGDVRFPGRFDAPAPEGFERVELKTTEEKRAFCHDMDRSEFRRWEKSQEAQHAYFEARRRESRSSNTIQIPDQDPDGTVRTNSDGSVRMRTVRIQDLSPLERDLLSAARSYVDRNKRRLAQQFYAGFQMETLEMDASNRERCDDPRMRGMLGSRK